MVAPCGEGPVLPGGGGIHSEIAGGHAKLELFPLPLNPLTRTALLPWFVRNLLDEGVDLNSLFPSLRGCCSNQTQRCNEFAWPLPAPPEACSHPPPFCHTPPLRCAIPPCQDPAAVALSRDRSGKASTLQPCPRIPSLSPSPGGNP